VVPERKEVSVDLIQNKLDLVYKFKVTTSPYMMNYRR
jgi:hypothetical protein